MKNFLYDEKTYARFETTTIEESYYVYDQIRIEFYKSYEKNEDLESAPHVVKDYQKIDDYQNDKHYEVFYYAVITGIKNYVIFEKTGCEYYGYHFAYKDENGSLKNGVFGYYYHSYVILNAFDKVYKLYQK